MNENKIICPLLLANKTIDSLPTVICRKERCAWWIEDKQKCAIAVLGIEHKKKG